MTNEEKFKGIVERLKFEKIDFDPTMLGCLIVTKYLIKFQELRILDGGATLTESGNRVLNVADEFEWKPSDEDIKISITDMINTLMKIDDDEESEDIISELIEMAIEYRDNPEEFIKKYES